MRWLQIFSSVLVRKNILVISFSKKRLHQQGFLMSPKKDLTTVVTWKNIHLLFPAHTFNLYYQRIPDDLNRDTTAPVEHLLRILMTFCQRVLVFISKILFYFKSHEKTSCNNFNALSLWHCSAIEKKVNWLWHSPAIWKDYVIL